MLECMKLVIRKIESTRTYVFARNCRGKKKWRSFEFHFFKWKLKTQELIVVNQRKCQKVALCDLYV